MRMYTSFVITRSRRLIARRRGIGPIRRCAHEQRSRSRRCVRDGGSNDLTRTDVARFSRSVCARASGSVRWRRRCLSATCRACSRAFLSAWVPVYDDEGPYPRQCGDRAPRTPMRRSTPSSVFVVGRRKLKRTDGGRSATLLLVAFPLPARSLLVEPEPRSRPRKNRLVARERCPPHENRTKRRSSFRFPSISRSPP